MKLENLFPVQKKVIPFILNGCKSQSLYPNDLCILAPTGSGKTLTYVLPIINNLKHRIVPCCKVLVILPVSDLAEQVYSVFKEHLNSNGENDLNLNLLNGQTAQPVEEISSTGSNLKAILLSNKNPFTKEQSQLINNETGKCQIDIVVATPGRLVDHIQKTNGFDLSNLSYLILDECDRIMDQIKQNWLEILTQAIFSNKQNERKIIDSESLNAYNLFVDKSRLMPLQKLLLSATLTRDPEKLEQMSLFYPVYFTIGAEKLNSKKDVDTSSGKTWC
jgi:ATP-dependent RNA helicase DDX51/DBP6